MDEEVVTEAMDLWGLTKQGSKWSQMTNFFGTLVLPRLRSGIMQRGNKSWNNHNNKGVGFQIKDFKGVWIVMITLASCDPKLGCWRWVLHWGHWRYVKFINLLISQNVSMRVTLSLHYWESKSSDSITNMNRYLRISVVSNNFQTVS